MHDEFTGDYRDMIYAETAVEVEKKRRALLRKWRLKCGAVADSLDEAGDRLFTFIRLHPAQWRSCPDHECDRAPDREVPPPDRGADRAALPGDRADAALGPAGLRTDPDAHGRWLANAGPTDQANDD